MNENKHDKFKRIATARTQRVLQDLRILGNCSSKSVYHYKEEDVKKIFSAIEVELKRVKAMFHKEAASNQFTL